jgi:copper chaperone CopZ
MHRGDVGQLRVLSHIPGRLRVHLPGWRGEQPDHIEVRLREVPGVQSVRANPLTRNVLVRFDRQVLGLQAIVAALWPGADAADPSPGRPLSAAPLLLRVGMRGLVGHAVVDALWFGAGFLGRSAGLPLAGALGPLHVLLDVAVWGTALFAK